MAPPSLAEVAARTEERDQRLLVHGVSWERYEALLARKGDDAGTRLFFLDGTLEIMTPSRLHEVLKTRIGRLLEAYAEERGIELNGIGSWTLKRRKVKRGAEPDECYVIGDLGERDVPDLAIEIAISSGGLDKLEVYRGLAVAEVWFWIGDGLQIWALGAPGYEPVSRSRILPELDLALLSSFVPRTDQTSAVREYRSRLRVVTA